MHDRRYLVRVWGRSDCLIGLVRHWLPGSDDQLEYGLAGPGKGADSLNLSAAIIRDNAVGVPHARTGDVGTILRAGVEISAGKVDLCRADRVGRSQIAGTDSRVANADTHIGTIGVDTVAYVVHAGGPDIRIAHPKMHGAGPISG